MTLPILVCDSNDREVWLEQRRTGIGGSDAPAILGLDKAWGNPFSVSCAKRGLPVPAQWEDADAELKLWGHYLEAPMIERFAEEAGRPAEISGLMYRSPEHHFQTATPDGVVPEHGDEPEAGIECKLVVYTADEWERYGVPDHVQVQCQHNMAVMGWRAMFVLALLDGYRLRWKKLERDDRFIEDKLLPAEADYWTKLQDGYVFDAGLGRSEASSPWLKTLHPDDNGETVFLPDADEDGPDYHAAWTEWRVQKEAEKAAKEAKKRAENTLTQGIAGATFGRVPGGPKLSWKTQTRTAPSGKVSKFRVLREVG